MWSPAVRALCSAISISGGRYYMIPKMSQRTFHLGENELPNLGTLPGYDTIFLPSPLGKYSCQVNVTTLQIGSYSGLDSSPYGILCGNHMEDRPVYLVYYH